MLLLLFCLVQLCLRLVAAAAAALLGLELVGLTRLLTADEIGWGILNEVVLESVDDAADSVWCEVVDVDSICCEFLALVLAVFSASCYE